MDTLTLACAQIALIDGDFNGNMQKAANMAQRMAAETSASVLLFPELCIEGNVFSEYRARLTDAEVVRIDDFWRKLARIYHKYLFVGKACKAGEAFFDSAICYSPSGDALARYDKAHLYDGERELFTAGERYQVAEIEGFRFGFLICADLGFPEFSRAMAKRGVDGFLVTSSWCSPHEDLLRLCCQARAAENACWLISCNRLGVETSGRENCGGSVAVSPSGEIAADLGGKQDAYCTVTIGKQEVVQRRKEIKWLEWLRPELYIK